ncbi:MAG: hypothetical protein IJ111_12935 [Eggerthellaceae bacterium]|nr:hypothetical protein [Eggerthellaceae bacterium]
MREAFLVRKSRRHDELKIAELAAYVDSDDCVHDLDALLSGVFDFPLPRQVMLRKSHSDRRRIVYVYPERQNALMKYLAWGMHEYDGIFSDSLYSFRLNRGVADLFRKIADANYARDLYTVKADVHDYGHSIRPDLLVPMLRDIMGQRDPALLAFLECLLGRNEFLRNGAVQHGSMGGLPGVPVGSFLNNVYLMRLDEAMERRAVLCSRYADDIAVFTRTREEAEEALAELQDIVGGLGLTLNEEKTQIIKPGDDVELLGIEIRDGEFDVADSTMAKARTKLTHYANKLVRKEQRNEMTKQAAAQYMAQRIKKYFDGVDEGNHQLCWKDYFFPVLTRPDSLYEIDHMCQGLLRYVGTGKRGDARYRFRYKDMKALGYRPLVPEYFAMHDR